MATTVHKYIKEDGSGDYTSVAAWESARQRNLVTADEIEHAHIQGTWTTAETGQQSFGGWGTDNTRYIILEAEGDARHAGKWKTDGHRWERAGSTPTFGVVQVSFNATPGAGCNNIIFRGLQVRQIGDAGSRGCFGTSGAGASTRWVRIESCIAWVKDTTASAVYAGIFLEGCVQVVNSLAYATGNHASQWNKGWGWVDA
ncbi:MAG: hypothetical protein ACYTFI_09640, partial [Planctomycetota bacterium]